MERWARGLSKTNALIFGAVGLIVTFFVAGLFYSSAGGILGMMLLCGFIGAGIGFSLPLLFKAITGQTPQERKESKSESSA